MKIRTYVSLKIFFLHPKLTKLCSLLANRRERYVPTIRPFEFITGVTTSLESARRIAFPID